MGLGLAPLWSGGRLCPLVLCRGPPKLEMPGELPRCKGAFLGLKWGAGWATLSPPLNGPSSESPSLASAPKARDQGFFQQLKPLVTPGLLAQVLGGGLGARCPGEEGRRVAAVGHLGWVGLEDPRGPSRVFQEF